MRANDRRRRGSCLILRILNSSQVSQRWGCVDSIARIRTALSRGRDSLLRIVIELARGSCARALGADDGRSFTASGITVNLRGHIILGETRGLIVDFWQIAMRPGKPLLFGMMGAVPVLGMPGNPVSALVCGALFLLPALALMQGLPAGPPPTVTALLGTALKQNDHRADHLRSTVATDEQGRLVVTPFPVQDSAMLRRLALADALVLRAPHAPALPAGSPLSYQSSGPFPDSFQGFINDPNSVLRDAIAGQDILGFIAINLTTDSQSSNGLPTFGVGSLFETVSNIPFLGVPNQTQNPAPNPLPVPPAAPYQPATLRQGGFHYVGCGRPTANLAE